ncbi:MAG: P-loop NTPase [Pseudomonadota bacterium]
MDREKLTIRIRDALRGIDTSDFPGGTGELGWLDSLSVSPSGVVKLTLASDGMLPDQAASLARLVEACLSNIEEVARTVVVGAPPTGSNVAPPKMAAKGGGHDNPLGLKAKKEARIAEGASRLADVKHVIAVASGKGGVGKSTVALYLALALKAQGHKVGLLDADIYGPSLPAIAKRDASQKPELIDGVIQPVEAFGLKTMSIGYLVDSGKALAWRGPMVMGATRQLINDVDWSGLDVLVIDTPPGTGDVHLTLARTKRGAHPLLDFAIVVTTPQSLAIADVERGLQFFDAVGVPVVGQIMNMAFVDTDSGKLFPYGEPIDNPGAPMTLLSLPLDPSLATLGSTDPSFSALPEDIKRGFEGLAKSMIR